MGTGAFATRVLDDAEYRTGYLCGLIRGDGTIGTYTYARQGGGTGTVNVFRLALCDQEALERARKWLSYRYIETRQFAFSAASGRPMQAIRTSTRANVTEIRALIAWPDSPCRAWQAGFLAGIFDAEGSYSRGILRISNTDGQIIGRIVRRACGSSASDLSSSTLAYETSKAHRCCPYCRRIARAPALLPHDGPGHHPQARHLRSGGQEQCAARGRRH